MDLVQITLKNGDVHTVPADTWGRFLKQLGVQMYDVESVYRV